MYLNISDIEKGMRAEVLNTLTRNQDEVATQAIMEAEQEVTSYLSARYDITSELTKTPPAKGVADQRLPMVIKLVRDIAIYNIYNFSAPVNIPDNRMKCYENAVKMLKDAQSEKAAIVGLARLTTTNGTTSSSYIAFGGNEKRQNHI